MDISKVAPDKRQRWRKDRKEASEQQQQQQQQQQLRFLEGLSQGSSVQDSAGNQAAELAFRGLHGRRSNFNLVAGAVDEGYQTVLGGNAFYYQSLVCRHNDFSLHDALAQELEYVPCWMSGGTPLYRPTALGSKEALEKSKTYEHVVRWLAGHFGAEPIRSLVNYYRDGDHYTSFHSDQYFTGVDMTIGASFGHQRTLVFEHRISKERFSFPQHNGDVFAFTDEVNNRFTHGVPRERRQVLTENLKHAPGRISVIVWARRDQEVWKRDAATLPLNLHGLPHVLNQDPNEQKTETTAEDQPVSDAKVTASVLEMGINAKVDDGQHSDDGDGVHHASCSEVTEEPHCSAATKLASIDSTGSSGGAHSWRRRHRHVN